MIWAVVALAGIYAGYKLISKQEDQPKGPPGSGQAPPSYTPQVQPAQPTQPASPSTPQPSSSGGDMGKVQRILANWILLGSKTGGYPLNQLMRNGASDPSDPHDAANAVIAENGALGPATKDAIGWFQVWSDDNQGTNLHPYDGTVAYGVLSVDTQNALAKWGDANGVK